MFSQAAFSVTTVEADIAPVSLFSTELGISAATGSITLIDPAGDDKSPYKLGTYTPVLVLGGSTAFSGRHFGLLCRHQ